MKRKDNIFTSNAMSGVDSNEFDLSHDVKFTARMGNLTPVTCMEVLPGDSWNIEFVNLLRFLPLVAPVMHKVRVKTDYFFVPLRILDDGWEPFITGTSTAAAPYVVVDETIGVGSIADYLGIPAGDYTNKNLNMSPYQVAAYIKIWDDWYRDQNQQAERFVPIVPGDNTSAYYPLLQAAPYRCAWEHDYFTSALPTTQQGTEVELPLTIQNNIPVEVVGYGNSIPDMLLKHKVTGATLNAQTLTTDNSGQLGVQGPPSNIGAVIDPNGSLVVDVQSDAATINDLRESFSLQTFLERTLRGGARYIEQIFSHFQVKSSDARLDRPELLGRVFQNMTIGEVLSTAQSNNDGSTAEIAVGSMAGHGISVGGSQRISYTAEEHGFIIGLMSVVPDTAYQDGLHKSFTRFDRLDYAWPSFAHLGEQPILNKEVLCHDLNPSEDPEQVWGYVPRYSEYRYMPSRVAGEFRKTLSFWTLGRIFNDLVALNDVPPLNSEFIECNPSTRIFALTGPEEDHIVAQVINKISVRRKLPRYGVPSSL